MLNFVHRTKVIAYEGAVEQIGTLLQDFEAENVLTVYDKGIKAAGLVDDIVELIEDAGIEVVEFDGVLPDPPMHVVNEAIDIVKEEDIDVIIAIGGGSSIDTAKAVNMILNGKKPLLEMADKLEGVPNKGLPFIAIPTTSGTGSEVSLGSVITNEDTDRKMILTAINYAPDVAILDPNMTKGMPLFITRGTGLDALAHCIEAYTTNSTNILCDSIATTGIELVVDNLPKAIENGDDLDARLNMSIAASLGAIAFNNTYLHLPHAFGHAIGTMYHIPHGNAIACVMPWCMEFVADTIPQKSRKICEIFGVDVSNISDEKLPEALRDALVEFNDKIGEKRFADYDMFTKDDLQDIAEKTMLEQFLVPFATKKMTKEDAYNILVRAYDHVTGLEGATV